MDDIVDFLCGCVAPRRSTAAESLGGSPPRRSERRVWSPWTPISGGPGRTRWQCLDEPDTDAAASPSIVRSLDVEIAGIPTPEQHDSVSVDGAAAIPNAESDSAGARQEPRKKKKAAPRAKAPASSRTRSLTPRPSMLKMIEQKIAEFEAFNEASNRRSSDTKVETLAREAQVKKSAAMTARQRREKRTGCPEAQVDTAASMQSVAVRVEHAAASVQEPCSVPSETPVAEFVQEEPATSVQELRFVPSETRLAEFEDPALGAGEEIAAAWARALQQEIEEANIAARRLRAERRRASQEKGMAVMESHAGVQAERDPISTASSSQQPSKKQERKKQKAAQREAEARQKQGAAEAEATRQFLRDTALGFVQRSEKVYQETLPLKAQDKPRCQKKRSSTASPSCKVAEDLLTGLWEAKLRR
eukprot:TRINITY_DN2372_c0_g1_i2.p1 TRINITY_DN2372_c0_g1~~TRINITY_DN2372_c0_g1_i2.p1  ORF type:complete len:418 (+),score=88.72 TRINITY_DN2372_c0_g1_i2:176-1429(+)